MCSTQNHSIRVCCTPNNLACQAERALLRLRRRGAGVGHRLHLPPRSLSDQPVPNTSSDPSLNKKTRGEKIIQPPHSHGSTPHASPVPFFCAFFFSKKNKQHSSHYTIIIGCIRHACHTATIQPICLCASFTVRVSDSSPRELNERRDAAYIQSRWPQPNILPRNQVLQKQRTCSSHNTHAAEPNKWIQFLLVRKRFAF